MTVRESLKLAVRTRLHRRGLSIGSDPYVNRLSRALAVRGTTTVLDVGANEGQYGALLRAAGYRGELISFEPLADAHARLSARSARDLRWTSEQVAVGDEPGSATIHRAANSYSSSLLPMSEAHLAADPTSRYDGDETVDVVTVDDVVTRRGIEPATTLLKIDTQGFESAVLDGATETLRTVDLVQLELSFVTLYDGQALHDELTARLRDVGLELHGLDPGIADPTTGRLLQVDALFARS